MEESRPVGMFGCSQAVQSPINENNNRPLPCHLVRLNTWPSPRRARRPYGALVSSRPLVIDDPTKQPTSEQITKGRLTSPPTRSAINEQNISMYDIIGFGKLY